MKFDSRNSLVDQRHTLQSRNVPHCECLCYCRYLCGVLSAFCSVPPHFLSNIVFRYAESDVHCTHFVFAEMQTCVFPHPLLQSPSAQRGGANAYESSGRRDGRLRFWDALGSWPMWDWRGRLKIGAYTAELGKCNDDRPGLEEVGSRCYCLGSQRFAVRMLLCPTLHTLPYAATLQSLRVP